MKQDYQLVKMTAENFEDFIFLLDELKSFENDPKTSPDEKAKLLEQMDEYRVALAYLNDKAIGFSFYFFGYSSFKSGKTLFIDDLLVLQEFRGQGLGKALFEDCFQTAKEAGAVRVEWTTRTDNYKAQSFYESRGYKPANKLFYRTDI